MHITPDLDIGGAELLLARLLEGLPLHGVTGEVISLGERGPLAPRIEAAGWRVTALGLRANRPDPRRLAHLIRLLRRSRPEVVQTWMYHADLAGGLAARAARVPVVVWGVHSTTFRTGEVRPSTRLVAAANVPLSSLLPNAVVASSGVGAHAHIRTGYPPRRTIVIRNGFAPPSIDRDTARGRLRRELGLPADALLVGRIAKVSPAKDHDTLLSAFAQIRHPHARLVLCGSGADPSNRRLQDCIRHAGLTDRCHLLGERDDAPLISAGLDMAVSSSTSEAIPLALGEAAAAGVPVVTTAVGDIAALVADPSRVVPVADPAALARAIERLLAASDAEREAAGRADQGRLHEAFPGSDAEMAAEYAALYRRLIRNVRSR